MEMNNQPHSSNIIPEEDMLVLDLIAKIKTYARNLDTQTQFYIWAREQVQDLKVSQKDAVINQTAMIISLASDLMVAINERENIINKKNKEHETNEQAN